MDNNRNSKRTRQKNGDRKAESNNSPEIPDIPDLPPGCAN